MAENDLELLRQARHGDRSAFGELVERYAGHLFSVAYALMGNAADAEDVVQESLAGAMKGIGTFRGEASVKTWLTRIVVRQVSRWRRAARIRRALSLSWKKEEIEQVDTKANAERRMDIGVMLETLSTEHREVIVLREIEQMSYEEISQVLGVPRGTVESRLHRARQALKERFRGYY